MKINHDIRSVTPVYKTIKLWLGRKDILGYFCNRLQWNFYPRLFILKNQPLHIDIELSSRCQLKCPMCFRFHRPIAKQGDMKFETFKKIIDEAAGKIYSVKFTGRGEPLMNKEFPGFIEYLKGKNIRETAIITNGQLMSEGLMYSIINAGINRIAFSVDGLKQEYENVRAPVKYEEIIDIVSRLYALRNKKRKKHPFIRIQSVNNYISDKKKFLGIWGKISDEIIFLEQKNYSPSAYGCRQACYPCPSLYQRMIVHYDGTMPMCINDEYEETVMGNILKSSINTVWKGDAFQKARQIHRENKRDEFYKNCSRCALHRKGHGRSGALKIS